MCGQTRSAVMEILLLCVTGNSSQRILRLTLQRAHEVTPFVRDETKRNELLNLVDRPIPPNLGEGGRLWQFGGAPVLNVPGTHIMAVDLPRVP